VRNQCVVLEVISRHSNWTARKKLLAAAVVFEQLSANPRD